MEELVHAFPKLPDWEAGGARPTLRQLEKFAAATYVPFGYFFLPEPPEERMPIPDFRTIAGKRARTVSPNLLDTLYDCQRRQGWYKEYVQALGEEPLSFFGSAELSSSVVEVAADMRETIGFDLEARRHCPTWADALRQFIGLADEAGVLVMCSGIVASNTHRTLDPEEFRGFALVDPLAPLVFVNGADTKAAQMFTLAHELAHVWIGQSALSDAAAFLLPQQRVERWCNRVAAEFLAPLEIARNELRSGETTDQAVGRISRRFKVSTLVALRRLFDAEYLTREEFDRAYGAELQRLRAIPRGKGGNFYLSQAARVSKRFARALFASTLEGNTLYRDAYRMLGVKKTATFNELGRSLGMLL